jgi:hypothetical protein
MTSQVTGAAGAGTGCAGRAGSGCAGFGVSAGRCSSSLLRAFSSRVTPGGGGPAVSSAPRMAERQ